MSRSTLARSVGFVLLAMACAGLRAQIPPARVPTSGSGLIAGRVIDGENGAPVPGAIVALAPSGQTANQLAVQSTPVRVVFGEKTVFDVRIGAR